jgi:hypothetical protein
VAGIGCPRSKCRLPKGDRKPLARWLPLQVVRRWITGRIPDLWAGP